MQNHGVQVGAMRPFDGSRVRVDPHLGKQGLVAQGAPERAEQEGCKTDRLLTAIVTLQAEALVWHDD